MEELQIAKLKLLKVLENFESEKHRLIQISSDAPTGRVFADVRILNYDQDDPGSDHWVQRRIVRTDIPHVFIWLFKNFAHVASFLPNYGIHKEEIFGRLGNTLAMAEAQQPKLKPTEKVAAVVSDFWEICQDMVEGRLVSLPVAFGSEVHDDFVSRSLNSGFVSLEAFEAELFGQER